MTAQSISIATSKNLWIPIAFAALLGLTMIVVAGHVQADVLHDAAHDVRHATGFPCH